MYAIFECGGKQYRVGEGDVVRVEKLNVEVGETVNIDKVLMLGGESIAIGAPWVEGAVVSCKVLNQDKDQKILVFHYKAKKNIRKRYGHRQPFTSLLVESISRDGQVFKTVQPLESESKTSAAATEPVNSEVTAGTTESTAAATKPVKKVPSKKGETTETVTEKPVKKTSTSAKKVETAATAEESPAKKPAARAKKTTKTEG